MKLPLAIYTAVDGFAWQNISEASLRSRLEHYRRAIGPPPVDMTSSEFEQGAFVEDETVIVYRIFLASNWDIRGRDAIYYAIVYFPREQALAVNIEQLLSDSAFLQPNKTPPVEIDYQGPPSNPIPSDILQLFETNQFPTHFPLDWVASFFHRNYRGRLYTRITSERGAFSSVQDLSLVDPTPPAPTVVLPIEPELRFSAQPLSPSLWWRPAFIVTAVSVWVLATLIGYWLGPCIYRSSSSDTSIHPLKSTPNEATNDVSSQQNKRSHPL